MKRLIVSILALFYLGTSTGATVHMHYCMGKLVDMGLSHEKKPKKCSKCKASENNTTCKKDCCKDVHKLVKLDEDHKNAENNFQFPVLTSVIAPDHYLEFPAVAITSLAQAFPVTNAPPQKDKAERYIFLCTFRI